MRTINVYSYNELSEDAKKNALGIMKECYNELNGYGASDEEVLNWTFASDMNFSIEGNVVLTTDDVSIILGM